MERKQGMKVQIQSNPEAEITHSGIKKAGK